MTIWADRSSRRSIRVPRARDRRLRIEENGGDDPTERVLMDPDQYFDLGDDEVGEWPHAPCECGPPIRSRRYVGRSSALRCVVPAARGRGHVEIDGEFHSALVHCWTWERGSSPCLGHKLAQRILLVTQQDAPSTGRWRAFPNVMIGDDVPPQALAPSPRGSGLTCSSSSKAGRWAQSRTYEWLLRPIPRRDRWCGPSPAL